MTVQHDKFLVNKTPTDALNSNFIGVTTLNALWQPFCPSTGVLIHTSALVHFMRFDNRLLPGAGWMLLVANGHQTA
jgi:hypothetical protein